jgi:hypothetical protein
MGAMIREPVADLFAHERINRRQRETRRRSFRLAEDYLPEGGIAWMIAQKRSRAQMCYTGPDAERNQHC